MNDQIKELKAQAYDILAQLEYLQKMLLEVNKKIAELQSEDKTPQ